MSDANPLYRQKDIVKLLRLHVDMQRLLIIAAKRGIKFIIIEADRDRATQELAFKTGHSHAHYGESAHDFLPSFAVDLGPVPYDPNDVKSHNDLAVAILLIAGEIKIDVTWGGSWHSIKDRPHYELTNWRKLAGKK